MHIFIVGIYPNVRARNEDSYIPPPVVKHLYSNTEITEDMYLPLDMVDAIFALPEEERNYSEEVMSVQNLFLRKIGNELLKVANPAFEPKGASYYGYQYLLIETRQKEELPVISFKFVSKDKNNVWYIFEYRQDGTLERYSYVDIDGIRYIMTNKNNEDKFLRKVQASTYKLLAEMDFK